MDKPKTVDVFMGTRPEAIKMAPVVAALKQQSAIRCRVIGTGQHREMFHQVAGELGFTVDVDLDAMQPNQTLAGLTARLMQKIDGWLEGSHPDLALVQGDTTTVLVAALACFYRGIPIGHVEAGLRTPSILAPFPEELNRRLASRMVSLHFAPTRSAQAALLREGVAEETIEVTGNTVVDALFMELSRQAEPSMRASVEASLAAVIAPDWATRPFVLITGHRRESFGEGFEQICRAIRALALRYPEYRFIYPVHLNPNVQRPVNRLLNGVANIALIPPQGYRNFVALMSRCKLILTDSGGVQEEAPSLGKPVLVMRETTERPEGIEAGTAILVGAAETSIVGNTSRLLDDSRAYDAMANAVNPYGDGRAAERIVRRIGLFFGLQSSLEPGRACSSTS
ncbi:MAG TPA: UDP-N-acetylglucosamine 2-epimerase (non-hydrolyzing) [Steroidobacteraceae bacterium]|nr:UDP-N-acetylglucosamine 2-epimerase (non-hydrolyzing) [Steroidobacteraceae bacterium]